MTAASAGIRPFELPDLAAIEAIYAAAVAQGLCTADLTPPPRERWEAWIETHSSPRYPAFVAEVEGVVGGYATLSPYRPGREALRSLAEISYYVAPGYRRRGLASELIHHAERFARDQGFRNLLAIVIDANPASLGLLGKLGYQEWGHLPGILEYQGEIHGQRLLGKAL